MVRIVILRLLESYFRHRWLYLLPIVLMLGTGVIYLQSQDPKYTAGGVLHVQQESFLSTLTDIRNDNVSWWVTPAQATSNNLSDLLQTDAFIRAIVSETELEANMSMGQDAIGETFNTARRAISTQVIGNNQVAVRAVHDDPEIAYQLVTSTIDNFIQWRINSDLVDSEAAEIFFSDLIDIYAAGLELKSGELRTYLLQHPEPIRGNRPDVEQLEINRLQAELSQAETRYARAVENDENARLATSLAVTDARQTYSLIDAPRMPDLAESSLKDLATTMGLFMGIGIVLSGVAVVGSALLDRSFRFPIDIQHALSLPILAIVPDVTPKKKWYQRLPLRIPKKQTKHKKQQEAFGNTLVPSAPLMQSSNGTNVAEDPTGQFATEFFEEQESSVSS